ncbi:helix-turn-helix domain-containing protein [Terriglobus sp. YAF25]
MAALLTYSWPGNIRELENLCKRFVIVGGETQILRELTSRSQHTASVPLTAPAPLATAPLPSPEPAAVRQPFGTNLLEVGRRAAWQAERRLILETLEAVRWNRKLAAQRLGISYRSLRSKIEQIDRDETTKRHLIA